MSFPEVKWCIRCKTDRPIGVFVKNRRAKDGLFSWCSPCKKTYDAALRIAKVDIIRAQYAAYRKTHREALNRQSAAYHAANAPAIRCRKAANRRADPAKTRLRDAEYRVRNGDRMRAYALRYQVEHPEIFYANNALYRAKKRSAATGDRKAYRAFVAWARSSPLVPCYWCKAKTKPGGRHIDHIIPLAKGGSDTVANLCVACPPCNRKKGARLPEQFADQSELRLA